MASFVCSAKLRTGDYHYFGRYVNERTPFKNPFYKQSSISHIQSANALYRSAAKGFGVTASQANFNIGFLHEYGLGGAEKDFTLAKRFYDKSKSVSRDGLWPSYLAITSLCVHTLFQDVNERGIIKGKIFSYQLYPIPQQLPIP